MAPGWVLAGRGGRTFRSPRGGRAARGGAARRGRRGGAPPDRYSADLQRHLVSAILLLEAARLLRCTDATVGEVAHKAGFTDPLYFSRAFKRTAASR